MMTCKITQSVKNNPQFHPQKMWVSLVFVAIALLCFSSGAFAGDLKIKDGDSFVLNGAEIRLWGIDAPEYNQICQKNGQNYPCGRKARDFLENLLTPLPSITCKEKSRAQKETRQVAQCFIDGKDIAEIMVSNGHAIDYLYFSKGYYANAQNSAKLAKYGIWAGEFITPREWRKIQKY